MALRHNGAGFDDCAECRALLKSLAIELSIPPRDLANTITAGVYRAGTHGTTVGMREPLPLGVGAGILNAKTHDLHQGLTGTYATLIVVDEIEPAAVVGTRGEAGNAKQETPPAVLMDEIEPKCLWCGDAGRSPAEHSTWCVHYRRPPRPDLTDTGFHWNDRGGIDHD